MNEQTPPFKRLYRSNENRVIAGICGGVGEYLCVDPVVVRLAWLALVFFGGSGIVLYILALLLVPRRLSS